MTTGADVLKALRTVSLRKVTVCGLEVYVRGLTGEERKLLRQRAKDGEPLEAYELAALATCDDTGKALFTAEQAAELATADGAEIESVAQQILIASKLMPEDEDAAAKNLGATRSC